MKFSSHHIHYMRFVRRVPDAASIVKSASRGVAKGALSYAAFQRTMTSMVDLYNRTLEVMPFDQRPASTALFNDLVSTVGHMAAFVAAGRNTMLLAPGLVDLLDGTDLGDIRMSDIRLPFDCFYLSFGRGLRFGLPGDPNVIDGAYVSRIEKEDRTAVLQFYITTRSLSSGRLASAWLSHPEPTFYVPLQVEIGESGKEEFRDDSFEAAIDRAIEARDIALQADPESVENLHEASRMLREQGMNVTTPAKTGFEVAADYSRAAMPTVQRVLKVMANALCYLSSEEVGAGSTWPDDAPEGLVREASMGKTPKRRQAARNKLVQEGFAAVRILDFHRAVGGDDAASGETVDRAEVAPHWRRGHWRRQAHGPGLTERRLRWIRPVLVRGDRGEAASGHVYLVRDGMEGKHGDH